MHELVDQATNVPLTQGGEGLPTKEVKRTAREAVPLSGQTCEAKVHVPTFETGHCTLYEEHTSGASWRRVGGTAPAVCRLWGREAARSGRERHRASCKG